MATNPGNGQPDESDFQAMRLRIRDLEEQIATMNDGTQITRQEYETLEKRLRNEQDDHIQVIRAYRDMESKLEAKIKKADKLEKQLKLIKEQKNVGNEGIRNKEQEIIGLQKDKAQMESLSVKHRQDVLQYIADNKQLSDANKRLQSHIQDVDSALVQMLERNKELARSLQESEIRNENLVTDLDQERKNIYKLEHEIAKLRDDERRGQRNINASRLDTAENNFANAQQKLLIANNIITELKAKIAKLEIEEQRAAKLQIELAKQKQVTEMLENQNDQLEMELESNRGSVEEYRRQIDDLREKNHSLDEAYEDRVNAMKVENEYYRKRTEKEFKTNTELEELISNKDKEIEDLKEENAKFLSGTYGLTQAVNEMRQLKAMVSVRDAQIADMILENQWDQKVISALEDILPSSFNFQKFFDDLQKGEIEEEQRRAEKQALELLKKTLEANKGTRVGEIKIILGSDTRHKKTLIVSNHDGDMKIMPNAPISPLVDSGDIQKFGSAFKNQRDESSSNSSREEFYHSDSDQDSLYASSQMSIFFKRKQRKEKERKMKEDILDQTLQSIPHVIASNKINLSDVSTQAVQTEEEDKESEIPNEPATNEENDKWVREMRNSLQKAKKEKSQLNAQLKSIKEDFNNKAQESANKTDEINGLKARNEELLAEIDKIKADLKQLKSDKAKQQIVKPFVPPISAKKASKYQQQDSDSGSISSESSARRHKKVVSSNRNDDDPLRAEYKNQKVQVQSPGITVSIASRSVYFEIRHGPLLSFVHNEESCVQFPTPDELEVIDARIKVLQVDIREAERNAAVSAQEVEEQKHKVAQKDEIIGQMQKTIENLENRLNEQRASFQEKITEMNNDAERILEARLKEARDMDSINNTPYARGTNEADLSEVSMRLAQLNRDKAKLVDELNDTKEAMKFMQRQNEQLKLRIQKLEVDNNEMTEKQLGSARQQSLKDYSSGLKMKFTSLQKKYTDLQRAYDDLKKSKIDKGADPLALSAVSRSSERSVDADEGGDANSRDSAKLKSALLKIEQIKTQNEEMQLRLGKAQTTIERLNQLLQRKEQQLTKLQEQASQYKHQLAKQAITKK